MNRQDENPFSRKFNMIMEIGCGLQDSLTELLPSNKPSLGVSILYVENEPQLLSETL